MQGETREQMLADVLRSAADLAPKIEEDGVNDAVIADNIEQVYASQTNNPSCSGAVTTRS